uniref:X ray repair complementing defective repair in chinese hamster cells 4 n=1 Tax=Rhipicephalus zambeziensis TaxID=60191 RepID=A0A224Z5L7_9ACAR
MSSQDQDECDTSCGAGEESSVNEFVQAIEIEGSRYYLHTVAKPSAAEPLEYELLLGDGRQCFTGLVQIPDGSEENACAFHAALTAGAGGGREFVYRLRPIGEERARFSWLRRVSHEMLSRLNEVILRRDPDGGPRLLAAALRIVEQRDASLNNLREKLQRTQAEQARTLEALQRSLRFKEELETELYAKFSLVLNAKKRFIRERITNGQATAEEDQAPATSSSASSAASVPNQLDRLVSGE